MKKYLYEVTIGILTLAIGVSSYYLYSNKEVKVADLKPNKTVKAIDIKDEKSFHQNKPVADTSQKVDNTKVSQKLTELNSMLAKTQNMLKEYNSQNKGNIIIKNEDIDKLVSLDVEQSNNSPTTPIPDMQDFLDNQANMPESSDIVDEKGEGLKYDALSEESTDSYSINKNNTTSATSNNSINRTQNSSTSNSTTKPNNTQTQNTSSSNTTNTQTESSTTNTTNNTEVSTQLKNLRTQIEKVKETINQVSSNVN